MYHRLCDLPPSVLGLYFLILCQRKNFASDSANTSDPVSLKRQDTLEVLQEDGYCAAFKNEFQLYRFRPDLDDWMGTFRSSRFSAYISDGAYLRIRGLFFIFMLAVSGLFFCSSHVPIIHGLFCVRVIRSWCGLSFTILLLACGGYFSPTGLLWLRSSI